MAVKTTDSLVFLALFLVAVSFGNQFLAFTGWLHSFWAVVVIVGWISVLFGSIWQLSQHQLSPLSNLTRFLLLFLAVVWLVLGAGIFVPEVAFDAVWYHLPVAQAIADQGGLVYIPGVYQSLNPLATDLFFVLGWMVGSGVGTKVIAFLWFITLQLVVFGLSRRVLSLNWSLVVVGHVALFQVVAWQSSSFYVDSGKAVWELLFLYLLTLIHGSSTKRSFWYVFVLGALLGNSLATKQFSILLVPVVLWGVWQLQRSWRQLGIVIGGMLSSSVGFFMHAWFHTGNPLFSVFQHTQKIAEIGQGSTFIEHLLYQLVRLPLSGWVLLTNREYVSPLVFVGLFFGLYLLYTKHKTTIPTFWWLFASWQWLIWWLVPPLSTRYALSGFIVLAILGGVGCEYFAKRFKQEYVGLMLVGVASLVLLVPRLVVLSRNWPVLTGSQTHREYIESKYDGWIDQHLQNWYCPTEVR